MLLLAKAFADFFKIQTVSRAVTVVNDADFISLNLSLIDGHEFKPH